MKIKKHLVYLAAILGLTCLGTSYFNKQKNTEGSDIWYYYVSLDSLKKYREKVGEAFRFAGLNNLSDKDYNKLEREKVFLDKSIGRLENMFSKNTNTYVSNEHGRYLSSD